MLNWKRVVFLLSRILYMKYDHKAALQSRLICIVIVFSVISRLYVTITKKKPERGLCGQMVYTTNCSIRGAGQVAVHDWEPSYLLLHLTMEPKSF